MKKPAIPAATIDAILASVTGGAPVRRALREAGINPEAFYRLVEADEGLQKRYARAKSASLDALADEIIDLSDECRIGKKTRETKDGTFDEYGDMVERSRLQIDARKWLLAKLAPKKYGDKVELTGQDGGPFQVVIQGSDSGL